MIDFKYLSASLYFVGMAPMMFVLFVHPRSSFRRLKSSAAFIKGPYNTESLLADAASAKYKVHIEHDTPLSSCSYSPSPYFPSVLIPTRTSWQKRIVLCVSAFLVVLYGLLSILLVWGAVQSYVNGDNSLPADAVWSLSFGADVAIALVCLLLGVATMKSSNKEDDAGCATVYFNRSKEKWVESSDVALFNSSEKIEISINWVQELLVHASLGILFLGIALMSREKERDRERAMSVVLYIMGILSSCVYLVAMAIDIRRNRQSISIVEVQLARAVSLECTEKDDVFKFDVKKVVRKITRDLAKGLGQKWMARNGSYYYFLISGEDGGLICGRMSAKNDLADP
ncbi:hypothetical protein V1504DRAFT_399111 [Lipomyces starkeyi]